jgi:hypothetical protein
MKAIVFNVKQVQVLIKISNNKEYDLVNYKVYGCILHASIPMKQTKVRVGTPMCAFVTYIRCPSMLAPPARHQLILDSHHLQSIPDIHARLSASLVNFLHPRPTSAARARAANSHHLCAPTLL